MTEALGINGMGDADDDDVPGRAPGLFEAILGTSHWAGRGSQEGISSGNPMTG